MTGGLEDRGQEDGRIGEQEDRRNGGQEDWGKRGRFLLLGKL